MHDELTREDIRKMKEELDYRRLELMPGLIEEVKRDCEMARVDDIRGLCVATAGSVNNGSLLTSYRIVMAAIQNFGRY